MAITLGSIIKDYREGVDGASVPDLYMNSNTPDTSLGSVTNFLFGWDSGKAVRTVRTLIHFDISDIPAAALVRESELFVRVQIAAASAEAARAYRVVQTAWDEASATWNEYAFGLSWTAAGCGDDGSDYTSTDGAAFNMFTSIGDQIITAMATLVQDAIDHRSGQLHLLLRRETESATDATMTMHSGEHATTSFRPMLSVGYDLPAVLGRRRREMM